MSRAAFQHLNFEAQIAAVWSQGWHIATRYEEEDAVGLYLMADGYFVELYYNQDAKHLVGRTNVFAADYLDHLEDYAV